MKALKPMIGLGLLLSSSLWAAPALTQEASGEQLYLIYCTQCHGFDGDGRGINAAHMSVLPRSHIDPVEMNSRSDADLFKVIKEGGKSINKSVLMPAWGSNLDDEQIEQVVRHLRTLCCGE